MTHICISDLTSIGSDNGLSPGRHQAIIRTNAGILLIKPLGTNFIEFFVEILIFSFKKMRLKVSSAKKRPFCLGLNELTNFPWKYSIFVFHFPWQSNICSMYPIIISKIFSHRLWLVCGCAARQSEARFEHLCYISWIFTWIFNCNPDLWGLSTRLCIGNALDMSPSCTMISIHSALICFRFICLLFLYPRM